MAKRVITFGEIMLRLAPEGYYRFVQANSFGATYGGGEANVAVSLANYGMDAAFVTKLVLQQFPQFVQPGVPLGSVAAAFPLVEVCAAFGTEPPAVVAAQDRGGEFEENIGGRELRQIELAVRYYYILIVVLTVQG